MPVEGTDGEPQQLLSGSSREAPGPRQWKTSGARRARATDGRATQYGRALSVCGQPHGGMEKCLFAIEPELVWNG